MQLKIKIMSTTFESYFQMKVPQPAITCLKLTIERLEQGVKYVQS